ncbi:MAG: helix-turn-helix domain-containing protein [Actinobacteria bacterium]|nr:helix-turn-helix domain-containing protein [Acidimicrobiia bacterium]NDB42172.1 helix-turn-helix domain-containing protein [Actinomycetota bacterium]NDF84561.1 helix-turn-helix domain-containing protein [Actinomycetota bacterium]
MKKQKSADLLIAARKQSGLTQAQMASIAKTTQSAIAAYEAGRREPTVPVLQRMLAATGHNLVIAFEADENFYRIADLSRDIRKTSPKNRERRLRLVFEFLREVNESGVNGSKVNDGSNDLSLRFAVEPESTGDRRFDAMLAAITEDSCVRFGVAPPSWVFADRRFLDEAWWVSDLKSARAMALVNTPASFRRRGVMIDRHDLVGA